MRDIRAGVIGAGVFGGHHARKYAADPRTKLTAIYDVDSARAGALAAELGCAAPASLDAFLDAVDIVTVASIPSTHGAAARAALLAGKHVLVEKPLAVTSAEGAALVRLADTRGLVLACGHQERLVFEAMGLFDVAARPKKIECVRLGPWTGRSADVSVTLDLMVHDIDLALRLMGEAPKRVSARGRAAQGHKSADEVTALIAFAHGGVRLDASRIAPERKRTMMLRYESGDVEIDFIARSFVNKADVALNKDFAETPAGRDPLGANVTRFIDAVTGDAARPAVTGQEALDVLLLALRIDTSADFPSVVTAESDHAPVH